MLLRLDMTQTLHVLDFQEEQQLLADDIGL
jgi:hypothetical protein